MERSAVQRNLQSKLLPLDPSLWPIAAVALFILAVNAIFVCSRIFLPYPVSPWEAGLVSDAWRMAGRLPVYGEEDRATTMYGPLMTMALAGIFEFSGPTLKAGRLINTSAGIGTVLLLLVVARRDWLVLAISAALMLAVNGWTSYYFAETRPDMAAAFLAVAGLLVVYSSLTSEDGRARILLAVAGSVLLLAAAMFKQTALAFIVVPVLAELIDHTTARRLAIALIPVLLALVGLFVLSRAPSLWHFMISVPAQYRISPTRFAEGLITLMSLPLFVLALLHWFLSDAPKNWRTPTARWLIAALVCAIPSSLLAYAKAGGNSNNFIPALFAIGAFCSWRAGLAVDFLRDRDRAFPSRFAAASLLGLAMLIQAFPSPAPLSGAALIAGHGTPERALVVAEARRLQGRVVSFDDPTIALIARGYAGRTTVFEADAQNWDSRRIDGLRKEIDSADYVITIRGGSVTGVPDWWPKEDVLRVSGFVRAEFESASSAVYQLWHRGSRP